MNNRKKSGGEDFVSTERAMQKMAIDLIDMRAEGVYVLVAIDYYTRAVRARAIQSKKAEVFVEALKEIMTRWNAIDHYRSS
jgi:hypothetical protein